MTQDEIKMLIRPFGSRTARIGSPRVIVPFDKIVSAAYPEASGRAA